MVVAARRWESSWVEGKNVWGKGNSMVVVTCQGSQGNWAEIFGKMDQKVKRLPRASSCYGASGVSFW